MKRFLLISIGSIFISVLLTFATYMRGEPVQDTFAYCLVLVFVVSVLVWTGNERIHTFLQQKYPLYTQVRRRLIIQGILNMLYTALMINIFLLLFFNYVVHRELTSKIIFTEVFIGVLISMLINAIYVGYYFFSQWKTTKLESEQLKKESILSQYEALKNQVNPHFLFNSLNTLATIIPEDPKLSVEFVEKLSNVYRYVLHNSSKEVVPLETEMEFVNAYIFLLKIRFGENLKIFVNVSDALKHMFVAPLTIQMLLENAVKHNIVSSANPLEINIYTEKDSRLVLKNSLLMKNLPEESTKIGLKNIINRYKYLTSNPVEIIVTSTHFIVALPLLQIENESTDR